MPLMPENTEADRLAFRPRSIGDREIRQDQQFLEYDDDDAIVRLRDGWDFTVQEDLNVTTDLDVGNNLIFENSTPQKWTLSLSGDTLVVTDVTDSSTVALTIEEGTQDITLSASLTVGGGSAQSGYELTVNGGIYAGGTIASTGLVSGATLLVGGGSVQSGYELTVRNDIYAVGTVSGATLVDRTPYPESTREAYEQLSSIRRRADYDRDDQSKQLDHTSMHAALRDEKSGGRNLSATVSMLTDIIQDLNKRIATLEEDLVRRATEEAPAATTRA
jgi:hypothetical protein